MRGLSENSENDDHEAGCVLINKVNWIDNETGAATHDASRVVRKDEEEEGGNGRLTALRATPRFFRHAIQADCCHLTGQTSK